jgi:hypothetical protein
MLLKLSETKFFEKGHLCSEWVNMNTVLNYKNILNCTKVADVESMGGST